MRDSIVVSEMTDIYAVEKVRKKGATGDIIFCLAGLFKDTSRKQDYIFHFMPKAFYDVESPFNKKLKEIQSTISDFSKNTDVKTFNWVD